MSDVEHGDKRDDEGGQPNCVADHVQFSAMYQAIAAAMMTAQTIPRSWV